jgi:hypothetical protein
MGPPFGASPQMRITASWFGLRSDRIQVRGAMACADYGKLPSEFPTTDHKKRL